MKIEIKTSNNEAVFVEKQVCYNWDQHNKENYEKELKKRQQEHLDSIKSNQNAYWQPCAHDSCSECVGTGIRKDGSMCIHSLSCSCPKCTFVY